MGKTVIGLNAPMAVKRYSGDLAIDAPRESYFSSKFMASGKKPTKPLWRLTDLEKAAGEVIYFDIFMAMTMQPVEGSALLHGKEEPLSSFTSSVYIDQMRGGVNAGGAMDRKRTLHDLREVARANETEWWGQVWDQIFFIYL